MSIGVFSDFRTNVPMTSSVGNKKEPETKSNVQPPTNESKVSSILKTAAPIVIPLAAIPITAGITYKLSNKGVDKLKGEIQTLTREIANLKILNEEHSKIISDSLHKQAVKNKKANAQIWSALLAAAGLTGSYTAGKMSKEEKTQATQVLGDRVSSIEKTSGQAATDAQQAMAISGNSLVKKYVRDFFGIQLLHNSNSITKDAQKYEKAIETIKQTAPKHLFETPNIMPITKDNPTIWSVTSEFAPIKEGGLGSVPVEVQNNVTRLGINIPTFIPMYQQKGLASFKQEGDKYFYKYKNNNFELKKALTFTLDTYQNGKAKTEDVEVFVHNSKDKDGNDKQLIFIKNDNYFSGTIYQSSEKTEEPEKFAFFSKAVYELAKAKDDINSVKNVRINDSELFNSIKSPDALILNDWQASPIAALARYKAPMENAYKQLSDEAAKKLSNMTIITIGHNTMYQGSTRNNNNDSQRRDATTNIMNTLFDNFAYDIVSNATTGASATNPADDGLKNLDNVLIINAHDIHSNHANLLNMGICLSDYFHPVSQNYTNEIISDKHPELAGELRWALNMKNDAGALVGIINGNDYNNISIEAKKADIIEKTGVEFETYTRTSDIEDIMKARNANKIRLYNEYILPFSLKNNPDNNSPEVERIRKISSRFEFVDKNGKTVLQKLSDAELAETPIISSVGRLVSQKGVGVMCDAIKMLMDNWEKDFPGKPKPIFYVGGEDGEGGVQRQFIEDLKNKKLKQEDSNRIIFGHGYAPMAGLVAGSDFFLLPSIFEPCGLTQGESFALGTPVLASAVGGIVDTVNRDGKQNGILTDKSSQVTPKAIYEVLKKGLSIYFDDKTTYMTMVKDSLAEDFSWIQKGKQGPVFDYLDKIGFDRTLLPDVA